jgi:hypothetical protein
MTTKFQHFDFDELNSLQQYYSPEEYFYEPFNKVQGRLASLQRFVYVNLKASREYMSQSRRSLMVTVAKSDDWTKETFHGDITLQDMEFYNDFLYAAVLTQLFSVFENVLREVIDMVREDLTIVDKISDEKIPIVNRYIKWLSNSAKIDVIFDSDTWATLDVLREIRNRFVHDNEREIPHQMIKRIEKLRQEAIENDLEENESYVWKTFETISKAIKVVEKGVIAKLQSVTH